MTPTERVLLWLLLASLGVALLQLRRLRGLLRQIRAKIRLEGRGRGDTRLYDSHARTWVIRRLEEGLRRKVDEEGEMSSAPRPPNGKYLEPVPDWYADRKPVWVVLWWSIVILLFCFVSIGLIWGFMHRAA